MTAILLLVASLHVHASTQAQNVNIVSRNISLEKVFGILKKETGYSFFWDQQLLEKAGKINIHIKNGTIKEALDVCLAGMPVTYTIREADKIVFLEQKPPVEANPEALPAPKDILIAGVVKDENGQPVSGATVILRPPGKTAINSSGAFSLTVLTNEKGEFSFPKIAEGSYKLDVSFVGYKHLSIQLRTGSQQSDALRLTLAKDVREIDETVVVGYGSVRKKDVTGSISQAPIADMDKAPVRSFDEALEGRIAGVVVSSTDGQPGSAINIVIRGNNSITQDNSPLYVVDGFPIEDPNNNAVNPSDIESIEVLKDASATAIYGARGANGVILITTKKGHPGPPVINFGVSDGIQQVTRHMDMMDPYDFVKYQLEIDSTAAGIPVTSYLAGGRTLQSFANTPGIDWQSYIYHTAPMQTYNLSMTGGSAQTRYAVSGSVLNQDGVIINTGYKRYQGRIVLEQNVGKKLKVGLNSNYSYLRQSGLSPSYAATTGGSATASLFYSVWGYRPTASNPDSNSYLLASPTDPSVSSLNDYRFNPILNQQNLLRTNNTNLLSANVYAEYSITPDLLLRVTGGIDLSTLQALQFNDSLTQYGSKETPLGATNGINGSVTYTHANSWVNENTLTYNKIFNTRHSLNVVAGMTEQEVNTSSYGFMANNLPGQANGVSWLESGTPISVTSASSMNTLMSFLGRANYIYRSKYLFTATMRSDGSSKFAPQNHWSYFPSGAVAWRFSEEDFMKKVKAISDGKLRASYGITGNNRVGDFAYLSQFSTSPILQGYPFGNTPTSGTVPTTLGNPNLKWETTSQLDIGLDLALLRNRIQLTTDVYRKKTYNLLLNANIPPSYGYSSEFENIGSVQNEGVELSLNTIDVKTRDFSWTSGFNIAFNGSKVLALTQGQESIVSFAPFDNGFATTPAFIAKVGKPLGLMYGPVWDGVYQYSDFNKTTAGAYILKDNVPTNGNVRSTIQPGDVKYKDLNGDGVVNTSDYTVIGRGLPIHTGGFVNNFSYKGFDLNVFFQWSYGNDVLDANKVEFEGNTSLSVNQFADYESRWEPDHTNTTMFRTNGEGPKGNELSSRIVEDGSYLRLKTVSLGYNLPQSIIKRWRISSFRIYVSGQNLYTWTKYPGMDPEVSIYSSVLTPDVDYSAYPRARTMTFGATISF